MNEFIPQNPNGKQIAALNLWDVQAGLFGGGAGPGKSSYLLMEALRDPWIRVQGYSALLMRRHRKDLYMPDGLYDRLARKGDGWLWPALRAGTVKWNQKMHGFDFLQYGSRIVLGYADDDTAFQDFLGSAYQFAGIDEAVNFSRRQLGMIGSRLRGPVTGPLSRVPIRYRLATNPGDSRPGESIGHIYIKTEYVKGADGKTRFYIPGNVYDNPNGIPPEKYEATMRLFLDEVTLQRYLNNDWDAMELGGWFPREKWVMLAQRPDAEDIEESVRYWDLAGTDEAIAGDPDYTVGVLMQKPIQGRTFRDRELDRIVSDVQRVRQEPGAVEELIKQTAEIDGTKVRIRIEEEPGQSGKSQIAHFKRILEPLGYDVGGNYITDDDGKEKKVTGPKDERSRPFSMRQNAGRVGVIGGKAWTQDYLDEMQGLWGNVVHDDQGDGSSGADIQLSQEWTPGMLKLARAEALAIAARKHQEAQTRSRYA
jgi:phage terminase large subunit-like protein